MFKLKNIIIVCAVIIGVLTAIFTFAVIATTYKTRNSQTSHAMPAYTSSHFVIHSNMDVRYVKFLQSNLEPFYEKMQNSYFAKGWDKPLDIYYTKSQSETRKLLAGIGCGQDIGYGVYISGLKAIFTHREMDSGGYSGLGTIYHEIIHYFVELNYDNAPAWFNEGLATFLGEQVRYVNNQLTLGCPNPWREHILAQMIESKFRIDVKYITSLSTRQFYRNNYNYHPTRALFFWMYKNGYLCDYMRNVKTSGYSLDTLEKTVSKPASQINTELLAFIKINCYPAAYYYKGRSLKNTEEKKACFQKALQIKGDYYPAMLELARCSYKETDYENTKAILSQILKEQNCTEYAKAHEMIADIYYEKKEFPEALTHYKCSWENSVCNEYRYWLAYRAGGCWHYMKNTEKAKHWYGLYIDNNWQPDKEPNAVKYAQNYKIAKTYE
ncbi:MAG: tetratricopeptide repeat protein [Sedimentisphaeraceae bacterium JB056]